MNTTLTEVVKALHTATPTMSVKEIRDSIAVNYTHLQADYRKVYNTLKRIWVGSPSKTQKVSKTPKIEKSSIIFDLTIPPAATVKGIVFKRGQHCK